MGEDGMTVIEDSEAAASRDSKVTSPWLRTFQSRPGIKSSLFDGVEWIAGAVLRIRFRKHFEHLLTFTNCKN
jgi:hypothetical protein